MSFGEWVMTCNLFFRARGVPLGREFAGHGEEVVPSFDCGVAEQGLRCLGVLASAFDSVLARYSCVPVSVSLSLLVCVGCRLPPVLFQNFAPVLRGNSQRHLTLAELTELWPLGLEADLFLNKVSAARARQIGRPPLSVAGRAGLICKRDTQGRP